MLISTRDVANGMPSPAFFPLSSPLHSFLNKHFVMAAIKKVAAIGLGAVFLIERLSKLWLAVKGHGQPWTTHHKGPC